MRNHQHLKNVKNADDDVFKPEKEQNMKDLPLKKYDAIYRDEVCKDQNKNRRQRSFFETKFESVHISDSQRALYRIS